MIISMIQMDVEWQKPEINRERIRNMVMAQPDAEIIILPEMFTTGFTMLPAESGERDGSMTLEFMKNLARAKNAAIAGSIIVSEKGKYYNRFYFVKPDGDYASYNKRHLFTYSGENEKYAHGAERVIVEYKGVRILLQICYDLRFPVFSRNRGDYDMIVYAANWPEPRIAVWDTLLKARAIENLCYVAGVNRVGNDNVSSYNGHSALIDFKGNIVASASNGEVETICAEINMEELERFRLKFPALRDADKFTLNKG